MIQMYACFGNDLYMYTMIQIHAMFWQ